MGAADGAGAGGHRRCSDLIDPQHFERGNGAHDIDDGVVPSHFMEVHLIDRASMQGGLHLGQPAKDGQCSIGHARRKCSVGDHGRNMGMGADGCTPLRRGATPQSAIPNSAGPAARAGGEFR